MHTHIKAFEAKHNVGYRTFALLTLLALETNTFASLGLIEGTYPSTVPPVGVMDSQAGISTVDPQDDTYREARAPEYAKKEIQGSASKREAPRMQVASVEDIRASEVFSPYASALAEAGIISKKNNTSDYRLSEQITRAEAIKMALGIAGIEKGECTSAIFDDVSRSLGDLCGYIEQGAEAGVVSRANLEFRPNAPITRAELTKILFAARGILPAKGAFGFYDVPESMGTLRGYINAGVTLGCINQARYFRPNDSASRGEAFKIASCTLKITDTAINDYNNSSLTESVSGVSSVSHPSGVTNTIQTTPSPSTASGFSAPPNYVMPNGQSLYNSPSIGTSSNSTVTTGTGTFGGVVATHIETATITAGTGRITHLTSSSATLATANITSLNTSNTLSSSGNVMTSNVGGSVGTGNIITSHTLTTSGSDLTSDTNGVKATMNLDAAIAYSVANNSGVTASMVGALSGQNLTLGNVTTQNLTTNGPVTNNSGVTNNGNVTNNANTITNGTATFNSGITVNGTTTQNGDVNITGNTTQTGNVTTIGNTTNSGDLTVNGTLTTNGTGITNGNTIVNGDTTVTGTGNFANTVTTGTGTFGSIVTNIIDAVTAVFDTLTATVANITTAIIDTLTATTATIGDILSDTISTGDITSTGSAAFNNASFSGNVTFANLPDMPLSEGALYVGNSSDRASELAAGASGQVLVIINGTPVWTDATSIAPVLSVFGRTGSIIAESGDYNTSQVTESGSLYFTVARARNSISGTGTIQYNLATGEVSWSGTTDDIPEGLTNLYFTDSRAQSALSGTIAGIDANIATLSGNLATLTTVVDTLSGTVASNYNTLSGAISTTNNNLTSLSGTVASLSGYVSTLSTTVDTLSGSLVSLTNTVNTLSGNLATTNTNLFTVSGAVANLTTVVNTLSGSLASLSGVVSQNTSDISTLSGSLTSLSGTVTNISNTVDTLSGAVAALQALAHSPVTLGTANGLSLSGQQLSLALASSGSTGALSATDWNTFNSKENVLTFGTGLSRAGNAVSIGSLTGGSLTGFTLGQVAFGNASGGLTQSSNFFWDNTTNRLGIGINTPSARLQVASSDYMMHIGEGFGGAGIDFKNRLSAIPTGGTLGTIAWMESTSGFAAGTMLLASRPSVGGIILSANGSGNLYVSPTGNVGIGTINPSARLSVSGSLSLVDGTQGLGKILISDASGLASWQSPLTSLSGSFWALGGNSVASTQNIGTTSNFALPFITNNVERMRIDTAGNVGIGTATPLSRLHIQGGTTGVTGLADSVSNSALFINGSSASTWGLAFGYQNINEVSSQYIQSVSSAQNATKPLNLNPFGGNVGIGTSAPLAKLHVFNTGTTTAMLQTTNNVGGGFGNTLDLQLWDSAGLAGDIGFDGGGGRMVVANLKATDMLLYTNNGASSNITLKGNSRFTGINTSAPGNILEINATTSSGVAIPNASGLRFTNLKNASILTTDANGDVVQGTVNPNNGLYWGLTGNSGSNVANNFIGTTDAMQLAFRTNNVEAMRIDHLTRNVGIGTTTPTEKLSVNGKVLVSDGGFTSRYYATASLSGPNPGISTFGAALEGTTNGHLVFDLLNNDSQDAIAFRYSSGQTATVDTIGMLMKANGNVGIGTSSPTSRLTVSGALTLTDGTQGAGKILTSDASGLASWQSPLTSLSGSFWALGGNSVTSAQNIGTTSNFALPFITNGTERMRIDAVGNVGIGTATPLNKLNVLEANGANRVIANFANSNRDRRIEIVQDIAGDPTSYIGFNTRENGSTLGRDFVLQTGGNERLRVQQTTGNVGIGTTAPTEKLEVSGNIKLTNRNTDWLKGQDINLINQTAFGYTTPTYRSIRLGTSNSISLGVDVSSIAGPNFNGTNEIIMPNSYRFTQVNSAGNDFLNGAFSFVNGSMGIGTATPASKLHVVTTGTDIAYFRDNTNAAEMKIQGSATNTILNFGNRPLQVKFNDVAHMTMDTNGNVGIGTSTPAQKLHVVNGNMGVSSVAPLIVYNETDVVGNGSYWRQVVDVNNMRFDVASDVTFAGYTSPMQMNANGNVGIGTTAPNAKLQVQGTIRATGYAAAPGANGYISFDNANTYAGALCYTSDGAGNHTLGRCTSSSARYKENIRELNLGLDAVNMLHPVRFDYKADYPTEDRYGHVGFIAEEVAAIDSNLAVIINGKIESVKYDKLTPVLALAIQQLDKGKASIGSIDTLSGTIHSLSGSVQTLMQSQSTVLSELATLSGQVATITPTVVNNTYTTVVSSGSTTSGSTLSTEDQSVLDALIGAVDALTVSLRTTFQEVVIFMKSVVFHSQVTFEDRVTFEDKDMAGTALIRSGSDSVRVDFARPYVTIPKVTVTADAFVTYRVTDKGIAGFTIQTQSPVTSDISFDWIALMVQGASTSTSTSTQVQNVAPTPETPVQDPVTEIPQVTEVTTATGTTESTPVETSSGTTDSSQDVTQVTTPEVVTPPSEPSAPPTVVEEVPPETVVDTPSETGSGS